MSRSLTKIPAAELSAFRPITTPRSLSHELVERLTANILSGELAPGSRLPTEQEMMANTGVSRTVVREAVAALRAEGLVVTRQGVGAFVADSPRRPFRINPDDMHTLQEVLQVMELRTGVEVEAAGLAAERATAAGRRRIADAFSAIEEAIERDESAVDQDFAFHCSIAEAADNPQFVRFLQYLGRFIIPRQSVRIAAGIMTDRRRYLEGIQREHREIVAAIRAGAVPKARAAMRRHLLNSRKRYQTIAAKLGGK